MVLIPTSCFGRPLRLVPTSAIIYQLATPFLLGSWWALLLMLPTIPLFILRTALEDRTLHEELEGYEEYAQETPYRLLPGVW